LRAIFLRFAAALQDECRSRASRNEPFSGEMWADDAKKTPS
jgi:hypothetical protein